MADIIYFDDLWRPGVIEFSIPIDTDERFLIVRSVIPRSGDAPVPFVLRSASVVQGALPLAGWWDEEKQQLTDAIIVQPGEAAALAVDRALLAKRFRDRQAAPPPDAAGSPPDPSAPLRHQFVCSEGGVRLRNLDVAFRPAASRFVKPSYEIQYSRLLNIVEQHDHVELARLDLTFEWQASLFSGEAPGFRIRALTSVDSEHQDLGLQFVQIPPEGESAALSHIPGNYDPGQERREFNTSLSTPGQTAYPATVTYRIVANPARLRAAMIRFGQKARGGLPIAAPLEIRAPLEMRLRADLDQGEGWKEFFNERGQIELTFAPDESVTLELRGAPSSIRMQLGDSIRPQTLSRLRANWSSDTPPRLSMQRQLEMTIRYHGIYQNYAADISAAMYAKTAENPAAQASAPVHEAFFEPVALNTDSAAGFRVPVFDMLKAALACPGMGEVKRWDCEIRIKVHTGDPAREIPLAPVQVRIDVEGEPDWILCVDLGTSAIAAWCGRPGSGRSLHQLPLGSWLEDIDKGHDESSLLVLEEDDAPAPAGNGTPARSALIPSTIGLASNFNLRNRYDALSLGSLDNVGEDPEAVLSRLKALNRRYDVSAPFPASAWVSDYFGQIVFEPKRKLITCRMPGASIRLSGGVLARRDGGIERTESVDLLDLLVDYFNEIATFLVPRVLHWAASPPRPDNSYFADTFEQWLDGAQRPQLIITHPTGMPYEKRKLYRDATQRFASSLRGAQANAPADVVLIPESLAAARFGISLYREQGKNFPDGKHLFIALDIGAGTYDVTVLTADLRGGDPVDWDIHSHFGLAVGGIELDRALARRVAEIVRTASRDPLLRQAFDFRLPDLPGCVDEVIHLRGDAAHAGMQFLRSVKVAKIRFTDLVRRDCDAGRPYAWSKDRLFSVKLGGQAVDRFPMALRDAGARQATYPIPGEPGAQLRIDTSKAIKTVWLDLTPGALNKGELAGYLELLGDMLPRVARAAARHEGGGMTPHWIVTGRTALWPDLYSAIVDVARDPGPDGRDRGDISVQPYPAADMKVAVIHGAQMMASEELDHGERVYNPLALVRTAPRLDGRGRRITSPPRYIPRKSSSGTFPLTDIDGPFEIARVVPYLDEPDQHGRTLLRCLEDLPDPPQLWWPVSHVRDPRRAYSGDGLRLRWESDGDRRTTITIENSAGELEVFGPYSEETVYGYD